jgi:hypothetical protein
MQFAKFLRSTTMLSGIVGASFIAALNAQAADSPIVKSPAPPVALPAVDGINYKGDLFAGYFNSGTFAGARGSVTVPLGFRYGAQLDGTLSSYRGDFLGRLGGHLFWRDPMVGLLGVYGSYARWSRVGGVHATHLGIEGEYYSGPWTVSAVLGAENGNTQTAFSNPFFTGYKVNSRFFDMVDLHYYLNENSRVSIGHRYIGGRHALALGGEWARPIGPRTLGSVFVEARLGEDKFSGIWVGLRAYYGQRDKSLIRRHREDDPISWWDFYFPAFKRLCPDFHPLEGCFFSGGGDGGGES